MTVGRFTDYGERAALPEGGVVVSGDAPARHVVERARRTGSELPAIGLLGGDLCRTLGGRGDEARLFSTEASSYPVDVGCVLLDGRIHWFVAHLVARRSWWRGRLIACMNAQWIGERDVAPRAHPGDGRFEVLEADLGLAERVKAWRRLATGTHVPHPGIEQRSVSAVQLDLGGGLDVYLDGEPMGRCRSLSVRVEADALRVVV